MSSKETCSDEEATQHSERKLKGQWGIRLVLGVSVFFVFGFDSSMAQAIENAAKCTSWQPDLAHPQLPAEVDGCRAAVLASTRARGDASVFFSNLAAVEIAQSAYKDAVSDLDRSLEFEPDNIDALNNRATASAHLGNAEAALSDYALLVKLHPHTEEEYLSKGVAYSHLSMPREAIATLTEAINRAAQGRERALALKDRAIAYQALGDYGSAVADFSGALLVSPRDGKLLIDRCFARARSGSDLQLALDDCEATQQGNIYDRPSLFESMIRTGFVLLKMERYPEALMHLDAALSLAPKSAAALYLSGYANIRLGKQEEGGAKIARAKGISSNIADVYEQLGLSR